MPDLNYQENSERINVDRASFASLPGELRNLAYATTLKWSQPISVTFDAATQRFHTPGVKRVDGRTPLQILSLLSDLDHNIRVEARSYFFANNTFELMTTQSRTTDPDYIKIYIHFLEDIGDIGRRSLRWLRLTVNGDSKQHRPTSDKAIKLWELVGDCTNLLTLDIYAEIDYFYMDQQAGLKMYMSTDGYPIANPWPVVLESIKYLTNLRRLVLRPVFSSRWRFFEVSINNRIVTVTRTALENIGKIRFRVIRPIDEASCLTDQIKGSIRRGLRGSVGVRVLMTELWEHYGAEVVIGRKGEKEGDWEVQGTGRCKPHERTFRYCNGIRD
ncbi:hypothetical protein HBI25_083500 [Parastagonospora nodorum]|nr:hypothetical protein HBI95_187800 [Parastagonospora nodorum]KAH5563878.1 hypothetical protein HBI25_083500 [Parastagonospora nodorum]KAH5585838.1 hypothetical protein HBI24_086230 [Parastagonospora nodorum]